MQLRSFVILALHLLASACFAEWRHLELGAGNYSPGQTNKYEVFKAAVERMVAQKGDNGVVFVNDLLPNGAAAAVIEMQKFAREKGWKNLTFQTLPGDFDRLVLPEKLDTIAMRNPGRNSVAAGDSRAMNTCARRLERFANAASEAFTITTYFHIPMIVLGTSGGLSVTPTGPGDLYRFNDGWTAPNLTTDYVVRRAGAKPPEVPDAPAVAAKRWYEQDIGSKLTAVESGILAREFGVTPAGFRDMPAFLASELAALGPYRDAPDFQARYDRVYRLGKALERVAMRDLKIHLAGVERKCALDAM